MARGGWGAKFDRDERVGREQIPARVRKSSEATREHDRGDNTGTREGRRHKGREGERTKKSDGRVEMERRMEGCKVK